VLHKPSQTIAEETSNFTVFIQHSIPNVKLNFFATASPDICSISFMITQHHFSTKDYAKADPRSRDIHNGRDHFQFVRTTRVNQETKMWTTNPH